MKYHEICWTELATTDVEAAKKFYGSLFGWKFDEMQVDNMTYTTIKTDDNSFGGIWQIPKNEPHIPPHWMSYILVESADDYLAKATQLGAKIIKPAFNISDFGRMAIFVDPTGAHIALWEHLKK